MSSPLHETTIVYAGGNGHDDERKFDLDAALVVADRVNTLEAQIATMRKELAAQGQQLRTGFDEIEKTLRALILVVKKS